MLAGAGAGAVGRARVGKSVLLASAIDLAEGIRVLQVGEVETEIQLAFAGLDQLVRPVLSMVERLPMRQAEALLGALGRSDHVSQDRFLVGAATLSLLSEAAEDGPLLCVVDDAQWLDRSSVEALAFATRRLEAEGIVLLLVRADGVDPRRRGKDRRAREGSSELRTDCRRRATPG